MTRSLQFSILQSARELIADEDRWCRGTLAITAERQLVCPTDPRATRRCALGAVIAAAQTFTNDDVEAVSLAMSTIRRHRSTATLIAINDFEGHDAVLAFFDQAIAEAI